MKPSSADGAAGRLAGGLLGDSVNLSNFELKHRAARWQRSTSKLQLHNLPHPLVGIMARTCPQHAAMPTKTCDEAKPASSPPKRAPMSQAMQKNEIERKHAQNARKRRSCPYFISGFYLPYTFSGNLVSNILVLVRFALLLATDFPA